MFEVDPSIGANAASARNAFTAASNARLANRFEQAYEEWRAHAKALEQQLTDAQARIAELELALAVKTAHAGGMKVWKDAFKVAHPQSPVQADSGKRFKDRDIKTVGRLAYEREFDRILRDARILNPEQYRAD